MKARKIAQDELNKSLAEQAAQLATDEQALRKLEDAIKSEAKYEEVFDDAMQGASVSAKEHAIATKGAAGSTDVFVEKQKQAQTQLQATAKASKAAGVAMKGLAIVGNMFAEMAIMWGVTKIIEGFEYISESAERAKEKLAEIQTELSDNNSTYQSNRDTLVGLKDEYDALTKKAESLGGAQNLANDEYERYQAITSQILGITPKLTTGWNNEGEAISNKNNLLQASIDLLDEEYEKSLRNNTTKSKNEDVASGVIAKMDEFNSDPDTQYRSGTMADMRESFIDELKKLETELGMTEHDIVEKMWVYLEPNADPNDFWSEHIDTYEKLRVLIEKDYDKFANSFVDKNNPIYELFSDEVIDNMIRNADAYFYEAQRILSDREALYQNYKDQLNWNAQATRDKSGNNAYQQLTDNGKAFVNEYIEGLDYASIKTEEDFVEMANDIQKFTKLLASNDNVSKLVEDIFTPANENETSAQYVERVQIAISDIQQYCKDNYIDLPINFTTLDDVGRMTEGVQAFLSDEFDDKVGELSLGDLQIASELEIDSSTLLSWDELLEKIQKVKDETSDEEITVPSFSSAFNAEDFKDTKENLLELAKSGELTPYTLSSTKEYKTLLDQTGLTAEQLYKKIMKVAKGSMDATDWQTTLDNSRKNIIALKEMKNSLSEDGISAVSSDVVSNYPELIGCLESETDLRKGINGLISDYETKAKEAYFNLVQDSESYYSNLKKNESAKLNTASKTINAIVNANKTLVSQLGGAYNVDLKNFKSVAQAKAQLEQQLIINSAKAWSKYYKVQLDASKNTAKVVANGNFNSGGTGGSDSIKAYEEQSKAQNAANASAKAYNEAINSLKKITNTTINPQITSPDPTDPDKATKSTTKFSQAIDWCAQTLSKLSKTIDLYSAKLENNTNSVKTQIKYYKELLNAQNNIVKGYAKTEKKYKSTYTKALKKLSKSDQKKVKEGTYTIEQFSGKSKKSGKKSKAEKRYNNIQKALEARDNYLDAQTDSVNAKNQLQEYAEDLASVRWDKATEQVEKLNNQISVLDTKMSNVSGYKAKNKVLQEQLDLQKNILTKQENAYKDTQSDANSYYKKISSKYKKNKNKDGTIKTKGVTNQTQLKYIKVYNAYVRQLTEDEVKLAQAQEDYTAAVQEATKAQFDNVQAEYDNKTNLNRTKQSRIQSQIDLREAYGEQAGTAYYDAMIRYNNSNKKHLEEEATSLQNELNTAVKNGKIEKYSDEWYEMANAIYEVQNSIDEMDKSTAEYQKALRELADTRFDNLIKQFDRLQSNMEFMGELLDYEELYDDNGNMTDEGIAKLGVLLSNLESKKVESEQIANRRSSLQELLTQAKAEGATSLEFEDATYSIEQAEEKLAELNDTAQDSILDYKSLEKTIADYLKEGMQAQIDAYNELIDKKKEALDADQDLYEFQKKMKESTQDIVQLERQLAALESDDSDEARKKRRELEQQLKEAKESQSDDLRDRAIEMEKENLDKQAEQYEKDMQDKMEHISENLDEFISTVNTNSENILTVLKAIASQNGYELPEEIEKIFNSEGDTVSNPNSTDTTSNTKTVSNNIVTSESEKNNKAEAEAIAGVETHQQERDEVIAQEKSLKQTVKEIMEQGTKKKVSDYPKGKKDASFKKLSNLNQYLVKNHSKKLNKTLQVELGKALGISTTTKKVETDAISKKIKNKLKKANIGYAQGGYINTVDLMEVAKTNGDDGWITAKNGEFMLTKVQSDNFLKLAKIAPEFVNATQAMMDNMNLATATPPYISNTAQPQSIDNSVSIQVNGNPDKDALRQMEKIAQNIVDSNQKQIQRMAYNRGMRIR